MQNLVYVNIARAKWNLYEWYICSLNARRCLFQNLSSSHHKLLKNSCIYTEFSMHVQLFSYVASNFSRNLIHNANLSPKNTFFTLLFKKREIEVNVTVLYHYTCIGYLNHRWNLKTNLFFSDTAMYKNWDIYVQSIHTYIHIYIYSPLPERPSLSLRTINLIQSGMLVRKYTSGEKSDIVLSNHNYGGRQIKAK